MGVDRVKHIFSAFGGIGLIIVQVGPHLLSGESYYDFVARAMADLLCITTASYQGILRLTNVLHDRVQL